MATHSRTDLGDKAAKWKKVVDNLDEEPESTKTKVAARLVRGMGSWWFVIVECVIVLVWLLLNWPYHSQLQFQFDAYPFGFLSLVLPLVAAVATPLTLLGQSRQAKRDRDAAEAASDYTMAAGATIEQQLVPLLEEQRRAIEQILKAVGQ